MKTAAVCLLAFTISTIGCNPDQPAKHNYQIYGTASSGEFLVDSSDGAAWHLRRSDDGSEGFVRVPLVNRMENIKTAFDALHHSDVKPVFYSVKDTTYEIMLSDEADFLKIYPNAKKLPSMVAIPSSVPVKSAVNGAGESIVSLDGGTTWTNVKTGKLVGEVTVATPDGATYTFSTPEQAALFKKLAKLP